VDRRALPLLLAVASLAACGASGSSGSSTDPGSADYDPAHTTLKNAGLAVCSTDTKDVPPSVTTIPGVGSVRSFSVAKHDCKGATKTPNAITLVQFTSLDTIGPGEQAIKKAFPNAAVHQHYPLVIVATGPDAAANLAAVAQQLPPSAVTTT
jgi:hypothetical protein